MFKWPKYRIRTWDGYFMPEVRTGGLFWSHIRGVDKSYMFQSFDLAKLAVEDHKKGNVLSDDQVFYVD